MKKKRFKPIEKTISKFVRNLIIKVLIYSLLGFLLVSILNSYIEDINATIRYQNKQITDMQGYIKSQEEEISRLKVTVSQPMSSIETNKVSSSTTTPEVEVKPNYQLEPVKPPNLLPLVPFLIPATTEIMRHPSLLFR